MSLDPIGIFTNAQTFLTAMIFLGGAIGAISRKLSIAGFGAFLIYIYVVLETDIFIFDAIMYLVLTMLGLWVSFYIVQGYLFGVRGSDS